MANYVEIVKKYNQEHLLKYIDLISTNEGKNNLINDINMDNNRFEKIDKLLEELNISQEDKLKEIINKAYNPRNDIKNEYLEEAVKEIGNKYVLTKDRKLSRRKDENNPYK